jgi:hypothetical protein
VAEQARGLCLGCVRTLLPLVVVLLCTSCVLLHLPPPEEDVWCHQPPTADLAPTPMPPLGAEPLATGLEIDPATVTCPAADFSHWPALVRRHAVGYVDAAPFPSRGPGPRWVRKTGLPARPGLQKLRSDIRLDPHLHMLALQAASVAEVAARRGRAGRRVLPSGALQSHRPTGSAESHGPPAPAPKQPATTIIKSTIRAPAARTPRSRRRIS